MKVWVCYQYSFLEFIDVEVFSSEAKAKAYKKAKADPLRRVSVDIEEKEVDDEC